MKKIIFAFSLLSAMAVSAFAQVVLPDPGPALDAWTFDEFDNARQDALIIRHQLEMQEAFKDASSMRNYIEAKREAYHKYVIGDMPERTPLMAKSTSVRKMDGFKVETVVYQSTPGTYVTSLLFLPDGAGKKNKVPAVLIGCGHSNIGKQGYAETGRFLAQAGIASLIVDPYGQGERDQFIDSEGESLVWGSTTEHSFLAYSSLLTGWPLASRIYWDNSRGIDYLCSRPEIDADKIGMTGNSGGGPQTMICSGLDRRIKAAAIGHSSGYGWANTGADGCALMPFVGRELITLEDVILMAAPAHLLFLDGKQDFVRIGLVLDAIENIRKAYDALGDGRGLVENLVHDGGHEYYYPGQPNPQERLVKFFARHLLGREIEWTYPGNHASDFAGDEFHCTSSGAVLAEYSDAVSATELNVRMFDEYAAQRRAFMSADRETIRAKVKELIGYETPEGEIKVEETACGNYGEYSFRAFRLRREGQVPVPCALVVPKRVKDEADVHICLYDRGKNALLASGRQMEYFLSTGDIILLADLRGFGETHTPVFEMPLVTRTIDVNNGGDMMKGWNSDAQTVLSGVWTGNTLVGQRVGDITTILDFCGQDPELKGRDITMAAVGHVGIPAVHAAFLDERIKLLRVNGFNQRYRMYLADPAQRDFSQDVIPNVIKYYDIIDLVKASGNIKSGTGL